MRQVVLVCLLQRRGNERFERFCHWPKVIWPVVESAFELWVNLMQLLCCTVSIWLNRLWEYWKSLFSFNVLGLVEVYKMLIYLCLNKILWIGPALDSSHWSPQEKQRWSSMAWGLRSFIGKLNSLVDLEETPGMLRVEFNLNLLVIPVDINVSILCLPPTPLWMIRGRHNIVKYILHKHIWQTDKQHEIIFKNKKEP